MFSSISSSLHAVLSRSASPALTAATSVRAAAALASKIQLGVPGSTSG